MNVSIRHILRPRLHAFPTLTPRYKTFPKLLPSNAVHHVRRLQLPAVTNSSEEKCSLKEEATGIIIQQSLRPLLKENGGKWVLTSDGMGMGRIFKFKGFKDTWNFMNAIAAKCKEEKHHPEWVNIYNKVFIRWTTHDLPGLSSSDILMATFCDEQATKYKEFKEQETQKEASDDIEISKNEEFLNHAREVGNKIASENPKTATVTLEKAPTPVDKATATPKEKSKSSKNPEVPKKNKEMRKLQAEEKAMQRTIEMKNIVQRAEEIRRGREAHEELLGQHQEQREKREEQERTENGEFLLSMTSGGKKTKAELRKERKEQKRIRHENVMRQHEDKKMSRVLKYQEKLRKHSSESGLETWR